MCGTTLDGSKDAAQAFLCRRSFLLDLYLYGPYQAKYVRNKK